jgi:putative transposase
MDTQPDDPSVRAGGEENAPMLRLQVSVPEVKAQVQALQALAGDPMQLLQTAVAGVRGHVETWLNALLAAELTLHVGREPYERGAGSSNHRNGYRSRHVTLKHVGTLELRVPRDREGTFHSSLVPERVQVDPQIEQDLQMLFLGGASTRTVELMSERLFGRRLSSGEVSKANRKLLEPVEAWRQRSLGDEKYLYLYLDGTNFPMRRGGEVATQCVLVVIGVTEARQRQVLALQAGDKESASAWKAVFQDLLGRGLDPTRVRLGMMDGLPGLEKAFLATFRHAKVQRCQVHKVRNVLAKVRLKDRKRVAADLRHVFYADDRRRAERGFERFAGTWKAIYPDAVACVEKDFDALVAYLEFPKDEWMQLRTTNLIERLHKEFKRRTGPMEIVAGEESVYRILAFVAMKMEVSWRRASFRNSGFSKLKPFAGYFTHES